MTITELCQRAHSNAKAKGFWDKEREIATLLMLIVTELAEAATNKGLRKQVAVLLEIITMLRERRTGDLQRLAVALAELDGEQA